MREEDAASNGDIRQVNENLVLAALAAVEVREATALLTIRRQDEFLAMLAHELRNPLAPIRTSMAVLDQMGFDPQVTRVHAVIRRQAEHMARLLDDLLDASRVTSGKVTLQRRPIAISEVVDQAVETHQALIETQKQHLNLDMPVTPVYVDGDLIRLAQSVGNLLHNAAKYTPEGGEIAVSVRSRDETVVIRVSDNGIGILAEVLPHVFELFHQGARSLSRSQGGLGIGLTVVRSMVELHGGTLEVRSPGVDQGSEFTITLPRVEYVPVRTEVIVPVVASTRARILVIDDNEDATLTLSLLLESSEYEVRVAFDGPSALMSFAEAQPQVVLCDIGLPGMSGYEVATQMREISSEPKPLMIALTGYDSPHDRECVAAAGFDHHAVKPVDPNALLRLIDSEMLRRSQT